MTATPTGLRPGNPYINPSQNWPGNVTIFRDPRFSTLQFENIGCSVTGVACVGKGSGERLLAARIDHNSCGVNILLFHGTRDGFKPSDKQTVLPFSDSELEFQGFDYAAIGHYHSYSEITGPGGSVVGAYSGCVQGRAVDESGEKSVILGETTHGSKPVLTRRPVGVRAIRLADVDVTGSSGVSDVCSRVEARLASEAFSDADILRIRLLGGVCDEIEPEAVRLDAFSRFFHVSVDCSGLFPDYDLDSIASDSRSSSLEAAFVRKMREKMLAAGSEDQRSTIRDGIYYGIDALRGRALRPRHED